MFAITTKNIPWWMTVYLENIKHRMHYNRVYL